MGKGKRAGICCMGILLAGLSWLLTACGGQEPVVTQMGLDGYVYVAEKVKMEELQDYGLTGIGVAGESLYYTQSRDGVCSICRIPLEVVEGATKHWNRETGETVFQVSSVSLLLPEGVWESGKEIDYGAMLDAAADEMQIRKSASQAANMVIDPDREYCSFYLSGFEVDAKGNLLCSLQVHAGNFFEMEYVGNMFCYVGEGGRLGFRNFLPGEAAGYALDGQGRAYLLAEEGIQVLDGEGTIQGVVEVNGSEGNDSYRSGGELYGDGEGHVYYLSPDPYPVFRELVEEGKKFKLKELEGVEIPAYSEFTDMIPGGNILFSRSEEGILCMWNREEKVTRELLRWQDSDMIANWVDDITPITADRLLVLYNSIQDRGVYLLTKTALEDLPPKEVLVLASLYPDQELWQEVQKFNRENSSYRIVVERYGAVGYGRGDDPQADIRLDATLASADPPDILDLSGLDVYKYTRQGALEDLSPYLEESGIDRELFLENVLEGYTIDGRLVCVPSGFTIRAFYGRTSQVGELESWTMEDVYDLTERYPESVLLGGADGASLLRNFCGDYCLEKFVDWEEGTCSFDSGEFGKLLSWLRDLPTDRSYTGWGKSIPEDILLAQEYYVSNFTSYAYTEACFGEKIRMLGIPGTDGKGNISCTAQGLFAMVQQSPYKEGAWEFISQYMMRDEAEGFYLVYGSYFPSRKSLLLDRMETATQIRYRHTDIDGNPVPEDGIVTMFEIWLDDEVIPFEYVPQETADELMAAIEAADFTPWPEVKSQVIGILTEEAESYFDGDKSLEDVIKIIQRRVQVLVEENAL